MAGNEGSDAHANFWGSVEYAARLTVMNAATEVPVRITNRQAFGQPPPLAFYFRRILSTNNVNKTANLPDFQDSLAEAFAWALNPNISEEEQKDRLDQLHALWAKQWIELMTEHFGDAALRPGSLRKEGEMLCYVKDLRNAAVHVNSLTELDTMISHCDRLLIYFPWIANDLPEHARIIKSYTAVSKPILLRMMQGQL